MACDDNVVALLNDDLTAEVEAVLVYMHSHFVLEGEHHAQLEFLEIALDEMRHIQWLAEAIVGLGGEPELTPRKLRFAGRDLREAVAQAVGFEKGAIAQYNAHIEAISDPKIQRLLAHIRDEEEDHLEEFEELLEEAEGQED